jgi:hypothetical protein
MEETAKIAQEIIGMKFNAGRTIGSLVKEFYAIMREHGIKKGTQQYNDKGEKAGVQQNNFEWTTFENLFLEQMQDKLRLEMLFSLRRGYEFPEDLECY